MDLDGRARQVEFAALVGVSQPAIAEHVKSGLLPKGGTYREWLRAYCERLREQAAGRAQSEARERRDLALAKESEISAELKLRQLLKEEGLLLDYDGVRSLVLGMVAQAQSELARAVGQVVAAVESKHGISIESDISDSAISAARAALAQYATEFEAPAGGDSGSLATAA